MSLLLTLYVRSKVESAITEAHEEREKNGPPLSLTHLLVLTFLGQLMKKADENKQATQQSNKKED
jgi:hypothetical protein